MNVCKATVELCCVLLDAGEAAWDAADLTGRLQEWWWVVTHGDMVDAPFVVEINERQERALQLAQEFGRVSNATLGACFPLDYPEMIRVDLSKLVNEGLLGRVGASTGAYYTLPLREG